MVILRRHKIALELNVQTRREHARIVEEIYERKASAARKLTLGTEDLIELR